MCQILEIVISFYLQRKVKPHLPGLIFVERNELASCRKKVEQRLSFHDFKDRMDNASNHLNELHTPIPYYYQSHRSEIESLKKINCSQNGVYLLVLIL